MIRIEGPTAYVDTVKEAFEVCDQPGVESVVIQNNAERLALTRITKAFRA